MVSLDLSSLEAYQTLYVGFSGGVDSTVLLHALQSEPSLKPKLVAIHVNHGLSSHAKAWEAHCDATCATWSVPFISNHVVLEKGGNLEARAREQRYACFSQHVTPNSALLLAHHQDDQVETILLHLCRGTGVDGLSGMPAETNFSGGTLLRPFLDVSQADIHQYAKANDLSWIEDESNGDEKHSRNFLRHSIIPALTSQWSGMKGNVLRCASHARRAQHNLYALAAMDAPLTDNPLPLSNLLSLDEPRALNVLHKWIMRHEGRVPSTTILHRILDEVIHARQDATPHVSWGKCCVRRFQGKLYLSRQTPEIISAESAWSAFPDTLQLSDGTYLQAIAAREGLHVLPTQTVQIRFREGGETFLMNGQRKSLKKLFQQWDIPPWERSQVPLVYIDDTLAAVVGYAISDAHYANHGNNVFEMRINCSVLDKL